MRSILSAVFALGLSLSAAAEEHGGELHPHGTVAIGAVQAAVSIDGDLTAGAHRHADVVLTPATPAPKAVRVWIGIESGRGSAKSRAQAEADAPGTYEAHLDVPATLPDGAQLWIEIEPAEGEPAKAALPLTAAKP